MTINKNEKTKSNTKSLYQAKQIFGNGVYAVCACVTFFVGVYPGTFSSLDHGGQKEATGGGAVWYHCLVGFIGYWFLFYRPIKTRYIDFLWIEIIVCIGALIMLGMSYAIREPNGDPTNFGRILFGVFPWGSINVPVNVLLMILFGCLCALLALLLKKLIIDRFVPDLFIYKNKYFHNRK